MMIRPLSLEHASAPAKPAPTPIDPNVITEQNEMMKKVADFMVGVGFCLIAVLFIKVGVLSALILGGASTALFWGFREIVYHVDEANAAGITLLHRVAAQGNDVGVKILLWIGANPNKLYAQGLTAMHLLAKRGDSNSISAMKSLRDYGANIDALTQDGATPLCLAVDNVWEDAVKALVEMGVKLDQGNPNPLSRALQNNNSQLDIRDRDSGDTRTVESRNQVRQRIIHFLTEKQVQG